MAANLFNGIFLNLIPSRIGMLYRSISTSSVCMSHMIKNQPHVDPRYHGQLIKRYGYEPHYHAKGLLPRLKIKESKLKTMPITIRDDGWNKREALMGQNDFIHILGDERIKPAELLEHVPEWLRGQKGREYSVLMNKRRIFDNWKWSRPHKWHLMQQRINFLYRRINNKYKPPPVELLNRSRYI